MLVYIYMQICVYEYSYPVLFFYTNNNYLHCSVHLFSSSVLLKSDLALYVHTYKYTYTSCIKSYKNAHIL